MSSQKHNQIKAQKDSSGLWTFISSVYAVHTSEQRDLHQEPSDSFISGESVALSVLDNVTAKCLVLLLSGKHAYFCPSCRTHWQTGWRGAARYGMEQNGDGMKGIRAVTDCMLFDLCGLTAPSVDQLKSELTILVLSIADQICVGVWI